MSLRYEVAWRERGTRGLRCNAQILCVSVAGALLMTAAQWARDGVLIGALSWPIAWFLVGGSVLAVLVPSVFALARRHAFLPASSTVLRREHGQGVVIAQVRGAFMAAFYVRGAAFVAPARMLSEENGTWTFEVPSTVSEDQLSLVVVVRVLFLQAVGEFDFRHAG